MCAMIGLSPVNFDFFNEKVGGVTAKEGSYCERGDLLRLFSKVIRKNGSSKFRMLAAWGGLAAVGGPAHFTCDFIIMGGTCCAFLGGGTCCAPYCKLENSHEVSS